MRPLDIGVVTYGIQLRWVVRDWSISASEYTVNQAAGKLDEIELRNGFISRGLVDYLAHSVVPRMDLYSPLPAGRIEGTVRELMLRSADWTAPDRSPDFDMARFDKLVLRVRSLERQYVGPEPPGRRTPCCEEDILTLIREAGRDVTGLHATVEKVPNALRFILSKADAQRLGKVCISSVDVLDLVLDDEEATSERLTMHLLQAYRELTRRVAEERIRASRDEAKRVAYATAYGAGPLTLGRLCRNAEEAREAFGESDDAFRKRLLRETPVVHTGLEEVKPQELGLARSTAFGKPFILPNVKKEDIVEQPGIDEAVRRAVEHYDDLVRRSFEACGLPREVINPPPRRPVTLEAGPGIAARTDLVTPPKPVHWRCPWDPEDLG